jgi:DNA-binding IclR family transcriptional regulator
MKNNPNGREVEAVKNSFEILNLIRKNESMTLTGITNQVDLSVGAVHTHLNTLSNTGLVVETEEGFRLSHQFIIFGEHVRNHSRLYNAGKSEADNIAEETGEVVHIIVEHNGREISLYETWGKDAVATDYRKLMQEELEYLHCTSSGKVILAHLPESKVVEIIDRHDLKKMTENTITDREDLFTNLDEIRQKGHAINDEEEISGIRAVAAPIMHKKEVLGSISISGPTARMPEPKFKNEYPQLLKKHSNIIEININTLDNTGNNSV